MLQSFEDTADPSRGPARLAALRALLAEENLDEAEGMSGTGVVITGSVVTAGAARTLFGKDPS